MWISREILQNQLQWNSTFSADCDFAFPVYDIRVVIAADDVRTAGIGILPQRCYVVEVESHTEKFGECNFPFTSGIKPFDNRVILFQNPVDPVQCAPAFLVNAVVVHCPAGV